VGSILPCLAPAPRAEGGRKYVEDRRHVRVNPEAEFPGLGAQLVDPKGRMVGQLYRVLTPRQLRMVVYVHEGGPLL